MRDHMRPQARSRRREFQETDEQSASPTRWLLILVVLLGTGLGVILLIERSRRQADRDFAAQFELRRQQQEAGSTRPSPAEPLPLTATPEELVVEAKRLADDVMVSFPADPQAFLLGGRIHYAFNDVAKAQDCWERCLQLDPQCAQAWSARGEAAWEHGAFAEAATYLEKAIEYDPQLDRQQVFLRADALMNVGRAEESVALLEKTAKVVSLSPPEQSLLGNGYLELKEYEKAAGAFEALLAIDPHSATAHYGLARTSAEQGQVDKARKHRQEFAALKQQELAQNTRSPAELRQKDGADVRPLVSGCCLNAGRIYALHGQFEQAERLWLKAAALDPSSRKPRTLLEMLHRQQGHQNDAMQMGRGVEPEDR